jgi:hypothetical protein
MDVTYPSGVGKSTLRLSGWGNAIVDIDNDGWKICSRRRVMFRTTRKCLAVWRRNSGALSF